MMLGSVPVSLGFLLCCRWLFLFWGIIGDDPAKPRVPSLILAAMLILIGVQLWIFGLIADLMGVNRQLLEDIQLRLRRREYESEKSELDQAENQIVAKKS
jgi:cell division protein FtsB